MDQIIESFKLLMQFYRGNGQTQGDIESFYINESRIICLPFTLQKDGLNKNFNNKYVNKKLKEIEELCGTKIQHKTLGKTDPEYVGTCTCKISDFYILTTRYFSISSPIICGTCNKSVPLYYLPKPEDDGYISILSWETNYISCDSLQMNCEVGEKWALKQMRDHTSQLSKQGITICEKNEELSKTPTYYFLYNQNKKLSKNCPKCNNNWVLKNKLHGKYTFKCNKCRLIG